MLRFGSLVLTLLAAAAPVAIAQALGPATGPASYSATAQKGRVLTQQGRAMDERAAPESTPADAVGAQPGGNVAKPRHDLSKGSIGNIKTREAAPGTPGGSPPPSGTQGAAASERALTMGRDKLNGTTRTSKPSATGEIVPAVDAPTRKVGQP